MHLANPAQLRRDLKEAAALRKWLGIDLVRAAVRLSEAGQEDEAKELQRLQRAIRMSRTGWRAMRMRLSRG
ncbi:hypothetical protein C4K03_4134 [Pseudomonas synxantha]|uniref:Uncharacterized protein n=1 Tax=Pseudomonas synxantha TaxID=47883 RepID=A0A3G7UCD0_9PSED|nr:hypothetical protein C4K03_4134 [Pseudomonas synxantha]